MPPDIRLPRLLLIDHERPWLDRAAATLRAAGFQVETRAEYDHALSRAERPDLIILGCTEVGAAEQRLVRTLHAQGQRLIVIASVLPMATMRALFRAGADDVTDKPRNPEQLLSIVRQMPQMIERSRSFF